MQNHWKYTVIVTTVNDFDEDVKKIVFFGPRGLFRTPSMPSRPPVPEISLIIAGPLENLHCQVWAPLCHLDHSGPFEPFCAIWATLGHFGSFVAHLAILGHLDQIGSVVLSLGHFGPLRSTLGHLGHSGPFGPL